MLPKSPTLVFLAPFWSRPLHLGHGFARMEGASAQVPKLYLPELSFARSCLILCQSDSVDKAGVHKKVSKRSQTITFWSAAMLSDKPRVN